MPISAAVRRAARVERHAHGPRLHLLGCRVHEWHLGLGLAGVTVLAAVAQVGMLAVAVLGAIATWLIAKDWRDIRPATRDTATWSLGIHRLPDAPAARPLRDRIPALAAVMTAAVGAVNIGSALTSELPARVRDVLAVAPAGDVRLAHALALPAGLALLASAWPLARRRRRALYLAVGLLGALGVLNMVKGLDVEEAAVSWTLAAGLWRARSAFWVAPPREALVRVAGRALALTGTAVAASMAVVAAAASHATPALPVGQVPEAAVSLLTLSGGPGFVEPFAWLPAGVGILGCATALAAAAMMLAPLRTLAIPDAIGRRRAAALVRRHGTDTLSAFKLRADLQRIWSTDGRAMAAYRVEAGTLLLAGDPVGPPAAVPAALEEIMAFAHLRGLAVGAVGASEAVAAAARGVGLRRLYLGDEAILATGAMDLSGGSNKSLRKAVARVARHGYTAELKRVDELDPPTIAQLHAVSDRWRDGTPERGFSMAHDELVDELLPDALVVVGRDEQGAVRGFLHFAPVFGRPVVSLGFMRRDRDTPNGLNDFLVVEAARLLGDDGIAEFSLNFATCGRWLRAPSNALERSLAKLLRVADRWFQLERLLRFNAKFAPRWQPRYLLFERPAQLPRVALAALWAEGQLPRPHLPQRRADRSSSSHLPSSPLTA